MGWSEDCFPDIPYKHKSPTLHKEIKYTEEEIWAEIGRIADESKKGDFSLGQNLYIHILLFTNPSFFYDQDSIEILEEYSMMKEFNIPLARELDSVDAVKSEMFLIIKREFNSILKYKAKNG